MERAGEVGSGGEKMVEADKALLVLYHGVIQRLPPRDVSYLFLQVAISSNYSKWPDGTRGC